MKSESKKFFRYRTKTKLNKTAEIENKIDRNDLSHKMGHKKVKTYDF